MMFLEINFDFMVEVTFMADTSFIEGEKLQCYNLRF